MGTQKSSNFDMNAQMPLDSKVYLNESERNNLIVAKRYKWMVVIDKDNGGLYQLHSQPQVEPPLWVEIKRNYTNEEDIPSGINRWTEDHSYFNGLANVYGYEVGNIVYEDRNGIYTLFICILDYTGEGQQYSPLTDITHWQDLDKEQLIHSQNSDIYLGKYVTTLNFTNGHPDLAKYNSNTKTLDLKGLDNYNIIHIDNTYISDLIIYNIEASFEHEVTILFTNIFGYIQIKDKSITNGNIIINGKSDSEIRLTKRNSFISIQRLKTSSEDFNITKVINFSTSSDIPEGVEEWSSIHTYLDNGVETYGYRIDSIVYYTISGTDRLFKNILAYQDQGSEYAPTGELTDTYWKEISPNELSHAQNTDIALGTYQTDITIAVGSQDESRLDIINKTLDLADLSFYNIINMTIDFDDTEIILNNILLSPIETTVIFNIISNNTIFKINDKSIDSGNIHINGNNTIVLNNGINHLLFKRLVTLNHYQLLHNENIDSLISDNKIYVSNTYGNNITAIKGNPFRSYKTLEAAVSAATFGDLIYVFKDDYVVNSNLYKAGISIYFENDTNVSATTHLISSVAGHEDVGLYGMNILGGGNFNVNGNFYYINYNSGLHIPINNLTIEFNNIDCVGFAIYIEPTNPYPEMCTINGNNINCLYSGLYLPDLIKANIHINNIKNNSSSYTVNILNYPGTTSIGVNTSNININYIKNQNTPTNTCQLRNIDANITTIDGTLNVISNCNLKSRYIQTILCYGDVYYDRIDINCRLAESIVNYSGGKVNYFGDFNSLINNGLGTFSINNGISHDYNIILNSGSTVFEGIIRNSDEQYNNRNYINVNGNAKVFINANCLIDTVNQAYAYVNSNFITLNSISAYTEINGNIQIADLNTAVNVKNGKLVVNGNIEMIEHNYVYNGSQAILYEGGEVVLNGSVLKTVLNAEQYPISCINNAKDIKILSGGVSLNKETFLPRKKKIRVTIGGTVTSDENYTITLAGTPYSSGTGHTNIASVVDALITAIGAAYTTTDNTTSLDIEDLVVSVDFTYYISKLAGSGTISSSLIRHATFEITPIIGTNIIVNDNI